MATTYDSRGNPLPTQNPYVIQTPNRDGSFNQADLRVGLPEGYKVFINPNNRDPGTSIQYTSPSGYTAGDLVTAQYKEYMFGTPQAPKPAPAPQAAPVGPKSAVFRARSTRNPFLAATDDQNYAAGKKKNPFLVPLAPNPDQFGLNIPT